VAHIFFNDSTMVFPPLLKLFGLKVVVSRRDLGFWYTPGNLYVLRIAAKFVDCVVANCEAVRDVVIGKEGFPPERLHVIYNGIRRPVNASAIGHRQDHGVPENVPLVVLVANLRPLKRVGDAVRALALAQGPGRAAPHLLIVGEDRAGDSGPSHRAELEEIGRRLGVSSRVHFAGKMLDPMPLITLADVCVLCSETEGLSNVVIEYMLAGKPVVCTSIGGNPELVVEGQTGRLIPVGNISLLASALTEILGDPDQAREWGDAARQRALALFSPSLMIERHQQLYEALAGSP
jgi:glycosyltransferase involved in cell wall biosynthesis